MTSHCSHCSRQKISPFFQPTECFSNRWKKCWLLQQTKWNKEQLCYLQVFPSTYNCDRHAQQQFSCGKCPYIDGAKHKYCSDNSAVKHICNPFFSVEHVALFPPDLTSSFLRHPLFLPFKFFPKSTCITDTETNSWQKDKLPLKPPG